GSSGSSTPPAIPRSEVRENARPRWHDPGPRAALLADQSRAWRFPPSVPPRDWAGSGPPEEGFPQRRRCARSFHIGEARRTTMRTRVLQGVLVLAILGGPLGSSEGGIVLYTGTDLGAGPTAPRPSSAAAAASFAAAAAGIGPLSTIT